MAINNYENSRGGLPPSNGLCIVNFHLRSRRYPPDVAAQKNEDALKTLMNDKSFSELDRGKYKFHAKDQPFFNATSPE